MRQETKEVHSEKDIIWLVSPFSKNVKTKLDSYFLKLIDKNFPPCYKFHKLFNRNNLKISNSTVSKMKPALYVQSKK